MKEFKVPFAYDAAGNIVELINANKNEVYKCMCGGALKMRGGSKVSNHFYHYTGAHCSYESFMHKAYKEVFKQYKKIRLPYTVNGVNVLEFDRVDLEKKIGDFVPDAIGYRKGKQVLVEFAKTSYIGERKLKKIKKVNLPCIEVDIINSIKSLDDIKDHLIEKEYYKHIIHVPMYKEMRDMRDKFKAVYYELKEENQKLKEKINTWGKRESRLLNDLHELEVENAALRLNSLFDTARFIYLDYVTTCKNNAKMYTHDKSDLVAFVTDYGGLTIKKKR